MGMKIGSLLRKQMPRRRNSIFNSLLGEQGT